MSHILLTDTVAANTGDLEPTEGDARRSHTLRVGRYAQHFVDALQMDSNPVEYLLNKYPKVSALLSTAGWPPDRQRVGWCRLARPGITKMDRGPVAYMWGLPSTDWRAGYPMSSVCPTACDNKAHQDDVADAAAAG